MKPFRKILVPVDFSMHSLRAVQVGGQLAHTYEGRVELVHVFDSTEFSQQTGFGLTRPQLDEMLARVAAELARYEQAARAAGAPQVESHVRQGLCVAEIASLAQEGGFDLIVMGTHGRSGLSRLLLGSVAERVLRGAPCPVLTVRAEAQPGGANETPAAVAPRACCSG